MIVAASDGRSGGLILFWRNDLNVTSFEEHNNYLDIRIYENSADAWRLTGIYGEPSGVRKHLTWDYVRDLHAMRNLPWAIMGDFNEILCGSEKEGGNLRPQRCMQAFRDVLTDCNLDDLGYVGEIFTWRRGRMRERLDRAVCNPVWSSKFPMASLINEDYSKSDHRPISLDTEYLADVQAARPRGRKRFEASWLMEQEFDEVVGLAWAKAQQEFQGNLAARLRSVHQSLHEWDRNTLKQPKTRLAELQKELNLIMDGPLSDEATAKQQEIQLKMENIREQEEMKWVQRSRANWMKFGDRNTNCFHNFANARKKKNTIKQLKDANGSFIVEQQDLSDHIQDYFQSLFNTEVDHPEPGVIEKVKPCVTQAMNEILCAPYIREEIKKPSSILVI
jgi:hypothetical protein